MEFLYQLVQLVDGVGLVEHKFDPAVNDVLACFELRGFECSGMNFVPQQREELQGQPIFAGLNGPMWGGNRDGRPVIRYEAPSAYDRLSA
jgi:hypothetical protein